MSKDIDTRPSIMCIPALHGDIDRMENIGYPECDHAGDLNEVGERTCKKLSGEVCQLVQEARSSYYTFQFPLGGCLVNESCVPFPRFTQEEYNAMQKVKADILKMFADDEESKERLNTARKTNQLNSLIPTMAEYSEVDKKILHVAILQALDEK